MTQSVAAALAPLGYTVPCWNSDRQLHDTRWLYVMRSGDLVKIGIATDVERRLHNLRAGAPKGLHLMSKRELPALFAIQTERAIHRQLADKAHGREWFSITSSDALKLIDAGSKAAWRALDAFEAVMAAKQSQAA